MSIKQKWQSFTGTDHVKKAANALVGKGEQPGETPEEREKREGKDKSTWAPTNMGSL